MATWSTEMIEEERLNLLVGQLHDVRDSLDLLDRQFVSRMINRLDGYTPDQATEIKRVHAYVFAEMTISRKQRASKRRPER